jgi:stage V sporulation protein B
MLSVGTAAMLFYYSGELGIGLYSSSQVGGYIRILSLLVPIMYLDSVTDGMLRGLGEHMYSMYINIADSVLSVLMVYFLVPGWAINGYIFMIYFTELFNFCFSVRRLSALTQLRFSLKFLLKSVFCAIGAVNITVLVLRQIGMALMASAIPLVCHITLSLAVYYILLHLLGCTTGSILKYSKKLLKQVFITLKGNKHMI